MFSPSSGGGGGGSGLEGGRERCEAPFVLAPVLVAGHEDGGGGCIDFFGTEGGVRECVEDEMAEDVAGAGDAVTDLELVLDRPCFGSDPTAAVGASLVGVLGGRSTSSSGLFGAAMAANPACVPLSPPEMENFFLDVILLGVTGLEPMDELDFVWDIVGGGGVGATSFFSLDVFFPP